MGYSSSNVKRVRDIYKDKYRIAQEAALARRAELWEKIPEVKELDRAISDIGFTAAMTTVGGGENAVKRIGELKKQSLDLQAMRADLLTKNGYPSDYSAVHYECEKCGDTGYVDTKMCECMKKALIMAGYESSGISNLMQTQTFDTFSLEFYKKKSEDYEKMTHVYDVMKNFAENFSANSSTSLALFGGTGLGKTHLSTSVAKKVIDKGFDVLYVSAVGMTSDFERERFGNGYSETEAEGLERYYECDLLILDDLGTEVTNQFTVSVLYNVINTRLSKKKSTIISTNLTPSELRAKYWDRIASRIFGEYIPLMFAGTDIRMQKLKK